MFRPTMLLAGVLVLLLPGLASAAQQTKFVGTASSTGSGTLSWNNPTNVTADDASYSQLSAKIKNGQTTRQLFATMSGNEFTILAGATIDGITVTIEMSDVENGGGEDLDIFIIKGGSTAGTDQARACSQPACWSTTLSTITWGGAANLWGTTWTAANINASDFGVSIRAHSPDNVFFKPQIDYVQITIDYTADSTTLSDHTAGQESDSFTESASETDAELFAFELDPNGGSHTVTQLVFSLSSITGLVDGDWAGVEIVVDDNDDGNIGGGETTTVGGSGTVSTAGGTITFDTDFTVSAITSYILRADFSSLSDADTVTIDLTSGNIASAEAVNGSATQVTHLEQTEIVLANHTAGQESDAFTESGSETDAELFGLNLTPNTASLTVTQLVFRLTSIVGLIDGDWAGIELVVDDNDDGNIGVGETTTVGGSGTVSTAGGTITFSTSFAVTATTNYILRADFASLSILDEVTIGLSVSDITSTASITGSATSVTHEESPTILEKRVNANDDDAEENVSNGNVNTTSTDLELINDGDFGVDQLVGMRFTNITIPTCVTVSSAYIQFTVDELDSGATSVTIRGEDIDDAAQFTTTTDDISDRTTTTASVAWNSIPAWNNAGDAGTDQRTPDISTVVQEILDRDGWVNGNDMVMIITGSGERTAESHNGDSSAAPLLHIEYFSSGTTLTLSDHTAGQESNAFSTAGTETDAELFAFKLDGSVTVTQIVFRLTAITGLVDGDWAGIELVVDDNNDGSIGGGETTTVGGAGVVSTAGGTITFSTSFAVSSATDYILRADFASLSDGDAVTINLSTTDVTNTAACVFGTITATSHKEPYDLFLYWKLDECSGASTTDSSDDTGNGGTLEPDATIGPQRTKRGRICGGLTFDGINDTVSAGDLVEADSRAKMTAMAWVKPTTLANLKTVISKFESFAETGWTMETGGATSGGSDDVRISFSASDYAYTTGNLLATGTWAHWAFVYDGDGATNADRLKFYLNGSAKTLTFVGTIPATSSGNTAHNLKIGATTDGVRYLNGVIDEVRMFSIVKSAAEVLTFAGEANFTVTDLGTLAPPDDDPSIAIAINNNATFSIAGFTSDTNDDELAWFWKSSSFTNLGTLGGTTSVSRGVNNSEQVVGRADDGTNTRAFIWDSGSGMVALGTLAGHTDSEAMGINATGEVAGTAFDSTSPPSNRRAFLWTPDVPNGTTGTFTALGTLGGTNSIAEHVNDSVQVVGGAQTSSDRYHPFRWQSGTMTDLGTLGGESNRVTHRGQAINASGQVAGMSYTTAGDQHAFLWTSGATDGVPTNLEMKDLGTLGGTFSQALGINSDGHVVGRSTTSGSVDHAFLWLNDTIIDLHDEIDINSTWVLEAATDISNDGCIVGWGTNPSSDFRASLLEPVRTCTCGGGGIAKVVEFPTSTSWSGYGTSDPNGEFDRVVFDSRGNVLGVLQVTDAPPGEIFEYKVGSTTPGSDLASVPSVQTYAGFASDVALDRPFTVYTSALPGSYVATVVMVFDGAELREAGVDSWELEMHMLDTTHYPPPGVWVPAGDDVGESAPTGIVGDSGFEVNADGTVDFWAVRDAVVAFAVGGKHQTAPLGDAPLGDALLEDAPLGDPPRLVPPMCGLGMVQAAFVTWAGLLLTQRRSRRC